MIYFLYGTDTHKARAKLHDLLLLAEKKRPGAELFKITSENWIDGQLDELIQSQGLFEQKYTVVLDSVFEKKDIKNYILERLEGLRDSEQIFLMLEGSVDLPTLKKMSAHAKQVQEFAKAESKKPSFNIFSITDHLVKKDKKHLWISYIDLLDLGAQAEEIHGILFWQIKNMILASRAGSQVETGLSPFVYKNALSGSRNFDRQELVQLSSKLVDITHRVRQGQGEMEVMLEKWVLEL